MNNHCTFSIIVLCVVMIITAGSVSSGLLLRQKRGFRNLELSTARGFGKRKQENKQVSLPDVFFNFIRTIPTGWLAEQIKSNPTLAEIFEGKTVGINGDRPVSQDDLYEAL
ncbi:uncharacterized protein LOC111089314 [Limulus polyphemus]|uniref:Uncharacterized protein LOC111089314 n=1 Tax=Limulus polyphemus TaxID=6850 RepID=A0ABM1TN36_LIMPO|nr:uncharacterized protein LOC111089314 [Limulus polyphemus]